MKLYELIEARHDIEELFANEEISFSDYQENLEMIKELIEEKAQNIIAVERNISSDIEAIKVEEDRLSKRRKALENKLTSFKNFVVKGMRDLKVDKIKTALGTVGIRKSQSVLVTNEEAVPEMFVEVNITRKIKKSDIGKALKDGLEVAGAELIEKESLSIR